MGAWSYVGPRIYTASAQTQYHRGKYPRFAGRDPTSSVATGSKVCCVGIYYSTVGADAVADATQEGD